MVLVVPEYLELGCQVHLAEVDPVGHGHHRRGEVQDRADSGGHQSVDGPLGGSRRGGHYADRAPGLVHQAGQFVDGPDDLAGDPPTHDRGVGVDQAGYGEAPGYEAVIPAEGPPQVADADDDYRAGDAAAERHADLTDEVVDVVAHAPRAMGVQVGHVLSYVGGVHASHDGEAN